MLNVTDNCTVYVGDCVESLRTMPDKSVHCCVTSPPYWGLRDYGTARWEGGSAECDHVDVSIGMSDKNTLGPSGYLPPTNAANVGRVRQYRDTCGKCGAIRVDSQLGLEKTPEEYVAKMVEVFREVRRVLRDDGTLFLNLGDSYATGGVCSPGLKPKDLVGIPWRVAFALQADGWYLRQDIIWAKPNPMPESVTDRCTKSHEYIFLMSKSARYWYDADAVKEAAAYIPTGTKTVHLRKAPSESTLRNDDYGRTWQRTETRNRRSVWHISTRPYKGAHFATFPPALIEPCIKAACPEQCCPDCGKGFERVVEKETRLTRPIPEMPKNAAGFNGEHRTKAGLVGRPETTTRTLGWQQACDCVVSSNAPGIVLDPFGGSGTTGRVASDLGRKSILCELNTSYVELIKQRLTEPAKPVKKRKKVAV